LDQTKLNRYVGEIEKVDEELLSEKMSYVARCKPIQERKKDWKTRARDDGIPAAALNTILKERALLRSIAKLNADVDDVDERAFLIEMREKLKPVADLPLFGAAIQAQEAKVEAFVAKPDKDKVIGQPRRRLRRGKADAIRDDVPEDEAPGSDVVDALGDECGKP
jgi:hypothetical protein